MSDFIKICIFPLLLMVFSSGALAKKDMLSYYCNSPGLESEQTMNIAQGYRVYLNQGAFSQIQDTQRYSSELAMITKQIELSDIQKNCAEYLMQNIRSIEMNNENLLARVYFSFDSSELSESSQYLLTKIVDRIEENKALKVEGHTDSIGNEAYNFSLGLRRAQSVVDFLEQKKGNQLNIVTSSSGERQPISSNATAEGRMQNRRVDIH